ncbi:hypothetical protein [Ramlibacter alkalitolerans]|uniref:Uncharacterized protein n=1 Tax=Ramlibacter alkalitolerans TaxID=2039631 RepID=A0ABS1JX10_9BURK|nr:hypothetical protein [Ramlibacter alkalitolerans]MBL0428676.1 hypothetical protein [Ramlibacter alkalitolerans]
MVEHDKVLRHGLQHAARGRARSSEPTPEPEEGSMLVSPAFWLGGLLSILIWVSLAAFFGFL